MTVDPKQLRVELEETQKDLDAFVACRAALMARVQEVTDYPVHRLLPDITIWSGSSAVMGSLDLSIHALERTVAELKADVDRCSSHLRLVEDE